MSALGERWELYRVETNTQGWAYIYRACHHVGARAHDARILLYDYDDNFVSCTYTHIEYVCFTSVPYLAHPHSYDILPHDM